MQLVSCAQSKFMCTWRASRMAEEGDLLYFSIVRKGRKVGVRPQKVVLSPYIFSVGYSCTFAGAYEVLISLCEEQFGESGELFATSSLLLLFQEMRRTWLQQVWTQCSTSSAVCRAPSFSPSNTCLWSGQVPAI